LGKINHLFIINHFKKISAANYILRRKIIFIVFLKSSIINIALFNCMLLIMMACNRNKSITGNKKDSLISCKMPSRATILKQSSLKDSIKISGNDLAKMVLIPGGTFNMGSNDFEDAQPVHKVTIHSFWIDEHEVTNAQFAIFVAATNYKTIAERPLNPSDYPGVPKDKLVAGSGVFSPPDHKVPLDNPLQWWKYVPGADWQHPYGQHSTIKGHENDPVVQVCYEDAVAYAHWTGKRLPTEAEWEYAARGGKENHTYYWGDELKPNGKFVANIFEGNFPYHNTAEDGYAGVAPVKSFPPDAYGLYDMEGNVWEWCADYYRPDYYKHSRVDDPQGPADSYDPEEPGAVKRVQRGGSFICSDEYCMRYKAGSRGKAEVSSASNNLGFRCAKDAN
jgi:formylglycine-generating enzyme